MGIFNKTEFELKQEEENRKWRFLINEIWSAPITERQKQPFFDYINKVRKGYPNDFETFENLSAIILKIIHDGFEEDFDFHFHLQLVIDAYHRFVNPSAPNVDRLRQRFIDDCIGKDGLIHSKIESQEIYSIFQDKEDYYEIMSIIRSNPIFLDHLDIIITYIMSVSKYCLTQDVLKRDILSYLDKYYEVSDDREENYQKINEECLEEAKKRIGIYNVDPKEIAKIGSYVRRVEGFFEQVDLYIKRLDNEKKSIEAEVSSGKKEIQNETQISLERLRGLIENEKQIIKEHLDQYLLDLEEALKLKSDATFRQIMETYQKQVEQFRNIFKGYSIATSQDLLEIQRATEESVRRLQEYVTGDPQLSELLRKAQEENVVRDKIIELVGKEEQLLRIGSFEQPVEENKEESKEEKTVSVPGYEKRIMVPYRHLVLPSEITTSINPFLDEKIPFSKRKEELYKKLEKKEKEGEIFHKKVPQIAIDVMEGDWPYLWGPSGTGKSYIMKQVAELLDMELTKAGKITEPYSILGYNDPQGRYQITPSFVAVLYGHLLDLDEMDNGNPDTQVVLNDIYSELLNKIDNPNDACEVTFGTDVRVDVHPNFRMIAAGNTSGEGENEAFSSRGKMDESIQERLTPIYIDYDDRVEERILAYPAWYQFFITFRHACLDYAKQIGMDSAQGITTTRDAAFLRKYIIHNSKTIDQIMEEKFIQVKDPEYLRALGRAIASAYGFNYDEVKDLNYKKPLEKADGMVLAKKFVHHCKKGAA